jgi:hypothetical protein
LTSGGTVYESAMTFEDVNLTPELLKGLHEEMGFSRPSKIQAITRPQRPAPSLATARRPGTSGAAHPRRTTTAQQPRKVHAHAEATVYRRRQVNYGQGCGCRT